MWIVINKNKLIVFIISAITIICILSIGIFANAAHTPKTHYIAIIIDDFGNNGDGTKEMLELSIPLTAAVMPNLPYTEHDANMAHDAGLEVIMHTPMQPINGKPSWLGPKGITTDLPDDEIKARINEGLEQIKWAIGMNNHMGSKATQDKRVMKSVLEIAKQRNMFFVDSKVTANSVIDEVASSLNVPCVSRDIFLDNSKNQHDIQKQLEKLGNIAVEKGYAIGIGHVGPEGGVVTAKAIRTEIPLLEKRGIQFTYISKVVDIAMSKK
ncbi:divergent polysaccharide deacetylase family protein [Mahella australiensis]|uniref:Divergent polysaccharide deacetylase n=1 Tax=Mahella australiensis (strain DSM 15567 / CIP 107919 / 50-1 BON) TaxID=697281 RepID=F4A0A3_MAHA5|nr:divergent polysaccharide deacetylase family protein [Mahella australiensis]AEE96937.1 protein of unknown function DUF610 YibQ [Mahella australiensis 50-1 BON]